MVLGFLRTLFIKFGLLGYFFLLKSGVFGYFLWQKMELSFSKMKILANGFLESEKI